MLNHLDPPRAAAECPIDAPDTDTSHDLVWVVTADLLTSDGCIQDGPRDCLHLDVSAVTLPRPPCPACMKSSPITGAQWKASLMRSSVQGGSIALLTLRTIMLAAYNFSASQACRELSITEGGKHFCR